MYSDEPLSRPNVEQLRLRSHGCATFFALAAALHAIIHPANFFAAVTACLADFRASLAVAHVKIAVPAHEVDAGGTRSHAVEHQLDVILLDMGATLLQTRTGQHGCQSGLTFLTVGEAILFRDR